MKKTVSSLIIYKEKVLLLLRDNISEITDPNKWQTIGGYVEEGESFDMAIKREIKEEAGLSPSSIKYYGKIINKGHIIGIYISYLTDEEVKEIKLGNEGQALNFFTLDEIQKLDLTPPSKMYFEKYLSQIERLINRDTVTIKELGLIT
ncbi:NUDIX domain-containing protein [Patescibacteria group bacterium]|nr:NUDIX domain-containing protein [Patescibacteria group bacterium]